VADVANPEEVEGIAEVALRDYGGIDTWVNNAGVSIYGRLEEISLADMRRLFDVNFWGVVHGCRSAVPILKKRGGAIITVGSTLSERSIPLQGIYCSSKHAVKGYIDSLRMELEESAAPISITLIKPAAINTPYTMHARSYLKNEPTNPPPIYAPEVVAQAILHAAQVPVRDVFVGGAGKLYSLMETFLPRFADHFMERQLFSLQETRRRASSDREDILFSPPSREMEERGNYEGRTLKSSLYTNSVLHPWKTAAVAGGLIAGTVLALGKKSARNRLVSNKT
jgi:short-subunit dehydrogenase